MNKKNWLIIKKLLMILCLISIPFIGFIDYKLWTPVWELVVYKYLLLFLLLVQFGIIYPRLQEEIYKKFLTYWYTEIFIGVLSFPFNKYNTGRRGVWVFIFFFIFFTVLFIIEFIKFKIKERKIQK